MLLLVNNAHEKNDEETRQAKFYKHACNLHLCFNFALMLDENVLIFSQSEVHDFFHLHYFCFIMSQSNILSFTVLLICDV